MDNQHFIFEKLDVYQLALEFAKKVYSLTQDVRGKYSWINQLSRAATSISLNIAEGAGRTNPKEKRNFYNIAKGSVFECVPLIDLGKHFGEFSDNQYSELRSNCIAASKMLTKLIQSVDKL